MGLKSNVVDPADVDRASIIELLNARDEAQHELFYRARQARADAHGGNVVVRGVIEITNVCRVDCHYCPMRKSNQANLDRFFMSSDDMVKIAQRIREAGIDVVLLQGGETPRAVAEVRQAIPRIMEVFDGRVEILLNLGGLRIEQYQELRDLGATSYILKHETGDADLHLELRGETLQRRLKYLEDLVAVGFKVGTGIISDLPGQSLESVVDDIILTGKLNTDMCSVSPFVPAPGTPLELRPRGSVDLAINAMAVLRLLYPHLLIPAVSALESNGVDGQLRGLNAGANVLTVNFSAQDDDRYLIYGKDRFVVGLSHVEKVIAAAGMRRIGSVFLD